jgi:hypothetical protein
MVDAEQLARAVIKQALADAGVGKESGVRLGVNEANRNAARIFLTARSGSWKAAREFWASLADLDAETLRTGTMKVLGIEPPPPEPKPERPRKTTNEPLRLFYPVPKPEKPKRTAKSPQRPVFIASGGTSKRQQVLAMLMRPEGVSLDEIVERFGWKRATAQTAVGDDLRKYGVRGKRCHDGRYRAVARD